jgi:SWI/SNF-related matrix-associated actin-dependent regulator 1 of chromatin subfamily A
MVRRLKKDVLTDLPPKRRQVIELPQNGCAALVKAESLAAESHEQALLELQAAVELAKAESDEAYKVAVQRLRKAVGVAFAEMSRVRHDLAIAKLPSVIEHLQSVLDEGNPVVAFGHHKDVIAGLKEAFPDAVTLTGDTKMADRQKAVDDFQSGKTDLFLGNIQAAGVGITLTRSSHVVFAELDWVPGNLSQAEDRCHRIGQASSVLVQHLVVDGSLDATMAQTVVKKQAVLDQALDKAVDLAPVAPTRQQVATVALRPSEIAEAAQSLTVGQRQAILSGLQTLAARCDGARQRDGAGFNKFDVELGKSLASRASLTSRQAVLGQKLVRKYQRQLSPELLVSAGIQIPNRRSFDED